MFPTNNIDLWQAIDSKPLIVSPHTSLIDGITLMNRSRVNEINPLSSDYRSNCLLIVEEGQLVGILTERDIVKLTANNYDFTKTKVSDVMISPVITLSIESFDNIFAPLFLLRRYQIRNLVIVSNSQEILGVITPETIRQVLKPTDLLKLRRVSEVMSKSVIRALPNSSIFQVTQLMSQHRVSCVVIVAIDEMDDDAQVLKPVGIVTERDVIQFKCLNLNLHKTTVSSVMSTPLFLLNPDDSLWSAHQEMQTRRVRRLVVSWDWGAGLGIVTQSSLLKVFDPIEMLNIDQTIKVTNETNKQKIVKDGIDQYQTNLLFTNLYQSLEILMARTDLNREVKEIYLKSIISDVQQLQKLFTDLT